MASRGVERAGSETHLDGTEARVQLSRREYLVTSRAESSTGVQSASSQQAMPGFAQDGKQRWHHHGIVRTDRMLTAVVKGP